jgi:hypothetical protein
MPAPTKTQVSNAVRIILCAAAAASHYKPDDCPNYQLMGLRPV